MKRQPTAKPQAPQRKTKTLTLADVSVSWEECPGQERTVGPEELAIILEHARRISTNFRLLDDASVAYDKLRAAEDFVQAISHTQENGDTVRLEAFWELRELIKDGYTRLAMSRKRIDPKSFRVTIQAPAPAGGVR
jgi:hypothetical protein